MGSGAANPAPTGPGRPPRRAGAGAPTREGRGVGSQPGNRALGQRGSLQAAVPPPGREGRRPRALRGLGRAQLARLGLELAARDAPGGQSLPAPRGPGLRLNPVGAVSSRPCPRGAGTLSGLLREAQRLPLDDEWPQ